MLNLWSSSIARRACLASRLAQPQRIAVKYLQSNPILFPFPSVYRQCSTSSSSTPTNLMVNHPPPSDHNPATPKVQSSPPSPPPPPPHVKRHHKIIEKVKEEYHRVVNGSKLLGKNTKAAALLLHGMTKGNTLSRRDKALMITNLADLIRMVPFIVIILVPFAEFALPVLLKFFPNMLPSTFTSDSQKEASREKKLQAKLKVLEILQAASESIALSGKLDSQDNRESLVNFMSKISRGEEIKVDEVLKISEVFRDEFSLDSLDRPQLVSLVKFFGLPALGNSFILQESLRFRWNLVRKDDAHIVEDGIDSLSSAEIEEAAVSRGFSHSNTHQDQKQYIQEWITLSQANVPPYLLLLSRTHYFAKNIKRVTDITPPIIAPYLPDSMSTQPITQSSAKEATDISQNQNSDKEIETVIDVPEKDIVSLEFKNLSHQLTYNPVVSKLWERIARYTSDLKKETFGGRQEEVIHLGDASAANLSTVITAELRKYLQALFIALDKDGDRKLTADEVEHGLHASDIPVEHDEVAALVRLHDADKDNQLSFDEFVDCILDMRKNKTKKDNVENDKN